MKPYRSRLGAALALLYTALAVYVVRVDLRDPGPGFNLQGFATILVTAPSQVTFRAALEGLGLPPVDYAEPELAGYAQLVFHVAVSAGAVYLVGYGLEWAARRWLFSQAATASAPAGRPRRARRVPGRRRPVRARRA